MSLSNSDLLKRPHGPLTALEEQRLYLLRLALIKNRCPSCDMSQNQFEAARLRVDDYDFGVTRLNFRCVSCGREIEPSIPFVTAGAPWYWALKPMKPA